MSLFQVQVFSCDEANDASNVAQAERAKCPFRNVFENGVVGVFDSLGAIRDKVHADAPEELELKEKDEKLFSAEKKQFGETEAEQRENARLFRRQQGFAIIANEPAWQALTGLHPRSEHLIHPHARAKQIRVLLAGVEKLLRTEMDNAASDCEKRSKFWDPLRTVCVQLGISQRRLSLYSKEITGISATEIVDCIHAESVRAKMKRELKAFITGFFSRKDAKRQRTATARSTTEGTEDTEEKIGELIWDELKATRKAPKFHRTTWALSFGFSSYSRFFRACLICYGVTPHELEMQIIEEILGEACENDHGNSEHEDHEDEKKKEHEGTAGAETAVVQRE